MQGCSKILKGYWKIQQVVFCKANGDSSVKELDFDNDVQDWKVVENNSSERDDSGSSAEANACCLHFTTHT